jgi:hypothetical protein
MGLACGVCGDLDGHLQGMLVLLAFVEFLPESGKSDVAISISHPHCVEQKEQPELEINTLDLIGNHTRSLVKIPFSLLGSGTDGLLLILDSLESPSSTESQCYDNRNRNGQ